MLEVIISGFLDSNTKLISSCFDSFCTFFDRTTKPLAEWVGACLMGIIEPFFSKLDALIWME